MLPKLLFCIIAFAFLMSSLTLLSSLLKLPINYDEQEVALCKRKVRVACPKDKLVFESFLALHFLKSISYTFAFLGVIHFHFFCLLGTICSEPEVDSGITILEGLAASGLRSVRYALEIPGVKNITANDISEDAYRMMKLNIQHNKVQHIVSPSKEDAGLVFFLFSFRWK